MNKDFGYSLDLLPQTPMYNLFTKIHIQINTLTWKLIHVKLCCCYY